ncbi:NAD(P)/FAD-dependent oxidoreductase [Clostridium sp. MT-14]|uniref:NAD(P)/FAD-dependent oxidoreductase n=1 Tax=Clostridium aromativorans TaxID=2836848 RepID=A0ABS8N8A6_9CLOT|nr:MULTISPECIES: NAD(P)/FAD-dependent oxidoreductase [Clostridium]KAA8680587.1 NAD(P)/FAD-dependent oxidoreductase [Clostridium sp. HV4-5-A1G]MCC9295310.1 NAD(P)/FAD-dependent oxidoreductase [Clostridium aromativorans]CAB1261715.1 Thioredoxin reductase [Clostridiaceae bacterium BL-3]
MDSRYDIAIVGSGPAGLSAAINAKIRNKNIILFGNAELSEKLVKAAQIKNYLGLPDITGLQLKDKFEKHIKSMNINIILERINEIYAMGEYFGLMVNKKMYEAKTIVLATGIEYTKPLRGEEKFLGRGVGYCATCDAPLYKGKIVTIIGYNKEAEKEANYVNELVKKVYYVPMYRDKLKLDGDIEVVRGKELEIYGKEKVEKVLLKDREIITDGVFVLKDSISPAQLVPGIAMQDNHVKIDVNMNTNIPGCFAAGDCAGKPYQYMKAVGQGQIAALNAVSYLDNLSDS